MSTEAFFQPVRNCESVRHADRFSLLIDGSDCFRVVREAITRAQRGWDIDSCMKLTRRRRRCYAYALGGFLHDVAATRKRRRIYMLAWDFAML